MSLPHRIRKGVTKVRTFAAFAIYAALTAVTINRLFSIPTSEQSIKVSFEPPGPQNSRLLF